MINLYRALGRYFFIFVRTARSVANVYFKRMAEGTCVSKPPTEEQLKLLVEVRTSILQLIFDPLNSYASFIIIKYHLPL